VGLPSAQQVADEVARALSEDLGAGDCTARLVPAQQPLQTRVICRDEAILCGRPWFDETFRQLDGAVTVDWRLGDGDRLRPGSEVCRLAGRARTLLSGERTALNFLQTLSGTASAAGRFTAAVAGTGAVILDTRKTIPGMRLAQKYAVRCGGASNHRIGLYDAVLIKENHIAASGSIALAVAKARSLNPELPLEVEVETLEQLEEAFAAGADRAMLDNFEQDLMRQAVALYGGRIELEASGGITLENVRSVAETGVDFISVGDITKNIHAVDFSMRFLS
jgi:nicotinate-nucleotide pyrophosphorylase (carboxylating)